MLTRLRIKNLAVVEDAEIRFGPGLNVVTGSTGAGKSLVLGAVNLLLGEKASPDQVRAGEERADVEAVFAGVAGADELGAGREVVLRREIRAEGRSQAYVDDRPITIKELQRLARARVEPHGQNEQHRLRDPSSHVAYLDAYAKSAPLVEAYRASLDRFRRAKGEVDEFERLVALSKERQELLRHRVDEVERAAPRPGERVELERSIRVLENAERIHAALNFACEALYDDDASALSLVSQSRKRVREVASVDETLAGFAGDLDSAEVALRECVGAIRAYVERMEFDPAGLAAMHERVDVLIGLEKRYAMPLDDLIENAAAWRDELDGVALEDDRRRELRAFLATTALAVAGAGAELGKARRAAARDLDAAMTSELQTLMMKGAVFHTLVEIVADPTSGVVVDGVGVALLDDGVDRVHMRVRPNPGEPEGGVDRIASTGEASRIALALKKLTQTGTAGSVMIFDEIDAGVGADLGDVIAEKLLELSAQYQIVCITHMPQIAARGARHLVVSKRSAGGRTSVGVAVVEGDARRKEIARMLGGESGSDHRMALAGELLARRPSRVRP